MRLTRKTALSALLAASVATTARGVSAEPATPAYATIQLSRDYLRLSFRWDQKPNFPPDVAVEFEAIIDPKCFARPLNGRDDDTDYPWNTNIPDSADIYRDVWNYWQPTGTALVEAVNEACKPAKLSNPQAWAFSELGNNFTDKVGNFAIGLKQPNELHVGTEYHFEYFFDKPTADCTSPESSWGFAKVRMDYFARECQLFGGDAVFTCPQIIGFSGALSIIPGCRGPNAGSATWLTRLCAETGFWPFTPGKDTEPLGTECVDRDGDQLFAIQQPKVTNGGVPLGVPMFGTKVGDCNDADVTIGRAQYNPSRGDCSCGDGVQICGQGTCFDGILNQGETGVDCGGPCPPCSFPCPFGDGLYCGEASLSQDPTVLYRCHAGVYSPESTCSAGCQVVQPAANDECKSAPPNCGNGRCEPELGENCRGCEDCCIGVPVLLQPSNGYQFPADTVPTFSWQAVMDGARYRIKICRDALQADCITCPGSAPGTCEYDDRITSSPPISGLSGGTWYWSASAIPSDERWGWSHWSAPWSFTISADADAGVPSSCVDECVPGQKDCIDDLTPRYCGTSFDADECWEMGPGARCGAGLVCRLGECVSAGSDPGCQSECTPGTQECIASDTIRICGNGGQGSCYRWVTAPCGPGLVCSSNECKLAGSGNPPDSTAECSPNGSWSDCGIYPNVGACADGRRLCVDGRFSSCTDGVGPQAETCNGRDDDCNGVVDDLPGVCGSQNVGECRFGRRLCVGTTEICDGAVYPSAEICDGKDNDCSGTIDDVPGLGGACDNGMLGQCRRMGVLECDIGARALRCNTPAVAPSVEICGNGLDDDCDGTVDNGCFGADALAPPGTGGTGGTSTVAGSGGLPVAGGSAGSGGIPAGSGGQLVLGGAGGSGGASAEGGSGGGPIPDAAPDATVGDVAAPGDAPLPPPNLLACNSSFEGGKQCWDIYLTTAGGGSCSADVVDGIGRNASRAVRLTTSSVSTVDSCILYYPSIPISEGKRYKVTLWYRTASLNYLGIGLRQHCGCPGPWGAPTPACGTSADPGSCSGSCCWEPYTLCNSCGYSCTLPADPSMCFCCGENAFESLAMDDQWHYYEFTTAPASIAGPDSYRSDGKLVFAFSQIPSSIVIDDVAVFELP